MLDAEKLLYEALSGNAELIELLGGRKQTGSKYWNRVYNSMVAPNAEEYPRITLFEVIRSDEIPCDDVAHASDVNIRVDVWTKDEAGLFNICKQVRSVLLNSFPACAVRLESKMYEPDLKVYHKPINVYLLLEQESDT